MSVDKIAEEAAHNWFTIAPKYRTKQRLAAHISDAINYAQIADMIVDEHNGGVEDNGSLEVEVVYQPRSEWPQSVRDAFKMPPLHAPEGKSR